MIHISFTEPYEAEWKMWQSKAQAAAKKLIDRAALGDIIKKDDIDEKLYKGCREALWKAFYGKCAYCEAKFILDQSGDVEHFRPKLGVTDENDKPVSHPGYYWVAYEWTNLLPSCTKCNRLSKTLDNKLIGKGERFPVEGKRWVNPTEQPDEKPFFIHPVFEEPEHHLSLNVKTGLIFGKTPRGEVTQSLLGLNREGLPEERKKVYKSVRGIISDAFAALKNDNLGEALELLQLLENYKKGEEAYSWAGRLALNDDRSRLQPLLAFLTKLSNLHV